MSENILSEELENKYNSFFVDHGDKLVMILKNYTYSNNKSENDAQYQEYQKFIKSTIYFFITILNDKESYSNCIFSIDKFYTRLLNIINDSILEYTHDIVITDFLLHCAYELNYNDSNIEKNKIMNFKTTCDDYIMESDDYLYNTLYHYLKKNKFIFELQTFYNDIKLSNLKNELLEKDTIISQNKKLDETSNSISNIENRISDIKTGVGFMELTDSFDKVLIKKNKELETNQTYVKRFGISILVIPIISILISLGVSIYSYVQGISVFTDYWSLIPYLTPIVFIESILIYYFRLFLNKYYSLSDQILQIENKMAIIGFAPAYIELQKKTNTAVNKENPVDFRQFEDMIFSKLSPNLKDVPSSPDLVSVVEKIGHAFNRKGG